MLISSSPSSVSRVDTNSGLIVEHLNYSGVSNFKSGIQMNTGSDKCYFLIQNSPSYNIQACEMSFASLNYLNCATIPSGTNINQLYYVNSSLMFLSGTDSTSQNLYLLLFNFNSVSIEWSTVKPFV